MIFGNKRREKAIFEIKADVLRDIRTLSELTGFTVGEIVNEVLEQTLNDNKYEFVKLAVYEHFMLEFMNGEDKIEPFELANLRVEMSYNNGEYEIRCIIKDDDGNIADDYTRTFSGPCDEFEKWLKELGLYIDTCHKDVENYLSERLDYREIFRKKN